jgi:uncharacterized protein YijF (DUF1287 family)
LLLSYQIGIYCMKDCKKAVKKDFSRNFSEYFEKQEISGGDALMGHTRSHPEHDG